MTRRRIGAAVVGAVLVALLVWWSWPTPEVADAPVAVAAAEVPREARSERRRRATPRLPEVEAPAAAEETPRRELRCPWPSELGEVTEARVEGVRGRVADGALVLGEGRLKQLAARGRTDVTEFVAIRSAEGTPLPPEPREPVLTKVVDLDAFLAEPHAYDLKLPGVGTARLVLPGDGTCRVEDVRRAAHVTGVVRSRLGVAEDRIVVEGCGARTRVDRDGGFYLDVDPEPCVLRASRYDGAFVTRSEPVRVDPRSDEEIVLDLDLAPFRAAGVGTQVGEHDAGILVRHVYPDTPAADAGLRPGDVVIALDGEPVDGLDVHDFVDQAVGPAGTEVTYTVLRDGEVLDVTMVREEMERPR